jgi:deferrochelatase/peroxidase EfeB
MQEALLNGPGRRSVVLCFDRKEGVSLEAFRGALAQLIATANGQVLPSNLHILVGLGWKALLDHPEFAAPAAMHGDKRALVGARDLPSAEYDAFIQIAAQTEIDVEIAYRVIEACLGNMRGPYSVRVSGGRLLDGQEHFGFRDGVSPEWPDLAAAMSAALVPAAQSALAGATPAAAINQQFLSSTVGTWLLFQPYAQKVQQFYAQTDVERANVIGRPPATVKVPSGRPSSEAAAIGAPPSAHFKIMSRTKLQMIRRGFPCRLDTGPALAFVGAAESPAVFADALDRLTGRNGNEMDALRPFLTPGSGSLFFCPPSATWLSSSVQPLALPAELAALLNRTAPMSGYEVAKSFLDYLQKLKDEGVFVGPIGDMTLAAWVKPIINDLHVAVAAHGSGGPAKAALDQLAQRAEDEANDVNRSAGNYVTFN